MKYELFYHIDKSIVFEDEKFKQDQGETLISSHLFQHYLEDFISETPDFVLLDNNGELEQIFDEHRLDIQTPIKVKEVGNSSVKAKMKEDIAHYENLLKTNQIENKNEKDSAHKLVATLRKQLKEHDQRTTQNFKTSVNNSQYPQPTKEELRDKGLREIFNFYSRQHIPMGVAFEELEIIMSQVDLGEFTSFCKDFKIDLPRIGVKKAFNSVSVNHKPLEFEQFYKGILRLGVIVNETEINDLRK